MGVGYGGSDSDGERGKMRVRRRVKVPVDTEKELRQVEMPAPGLEVEREPAVGGRKQRPTRFQELLLSRAQAAAHWLVRSMDVCGGEGSAAFYSRWYHPFKGWERPYPETTGYIIPTLIELAAFLGRSEYGPLAVSQADWLASLQFDNGAFPGSWIIEGRDPEPSIFNTGQIVLGLVAASDYTQEERYLASAARAAAWLADEVDESAEMWTTHGYVKGTSPAYYSRVCWPMLEVYSRAGNGKVREAAVRVLGTIARWQQDNGAFANWGFRPTRPAFTHTIAYTVRGLLESGRLLGEAGEPFISAAIKTADVLRRRMELRGRLAGAYDLKLKGRYWYTCLSGNCQMSIIWMKLFEQLGDARYLSAALKALQYVINRQRMRCLDPNVRGAIRGSNPHWGRYLVLRYPNWAAKFYLDALMQAHGSLQRLLEGGPCGSS